MKNTPLAPAEELLKKIQELEAGHAQLKQEISNFLISGDHNFSHQRSQSISPQRRPAVPRVDGGGGSDSGPTAASFKMGSAPFRHSSPLWSESGSGSLVGDNSGTGTPPCRQHKQPEFKFTDRQFLNILESMGQAVHIFDVNGNIFYWNRPAECLYGYSAAEAHGRISIELLVDPQEKDVAYSVVNHTLTTGESWTGKFPIRTKKGIRFEVVATNTPFYDDYGRLIGIICVSNDSRSYEGTRSSLSAAQLSETDSNLSPPRRAASAKLGLDPQKPLQVTIASKISNLASKVSNKVKSKLKTGDNIMDGEGGSGGSLHSDTTLSDHKEDALSSGTSTLKGEIPPFPLGVFSHAPHDTYSSGKDSRDSGDENDRKPGIHKIITSKAESWMGKKGQMWPWKGNDREGSESRTAHFVMPWLLNEQGSDSAEQMNFSAPARPETQVSDTNRMAHSEASESYSSFTVNSNESSYGSNSSSTINRVEMYTDSLDYEILWEDLTIGEQVGQGSCGTVYHALWYGSDVAVKVFPKLDYADDVILAFRQEVSLMKRLRHPNILLFMGAVTSPQRLCIVTEFLTRGSLFKLLRKITSRLDWRRRVQMALDIARGMNYLHHCSPPIIHRDLKSSNLLVDKNWSVKVGDFGLSRFKHDTYLTTKTGKGTPQWMAPEALRNDPSDERSDIYSYGVILWELATEKIPWDNLNSMQVIGVVGFMNQRLEIPKDMDPQWASIIESCWDSEPRNRPTFQELLEKLKDLQRQYAVKFQLSRSSAGETAIRE